MVKFESTIAKDQTLTLFRGSDTSVPSIDTSIDEVLQVVPTSQSVCWSPSGVIYVLHARGTRTKEVEGPRLTFV